MVDFRIYRYAFAPALLAFVALMFSLQGVPAAIEPVAPPASFESGPAAATAREIVETAPERQPGSAGDEAIADLVAERFAEIEVGTVSEQTLEASFDGDDVSVRNVILTLPGDSPASIVVLAGRDSADGPGAASSAAATGALVELGGALAVSGHARTYVLASTSATTAGAAGAREAVAAVPDPGAVEAVVVLSQPGSEDPRGPYVIDSSTGTTRTAAQLVSTAELAVAEQAGREAGQPGVVSQLARLAFPSGLGEQAPLIAAGFDAVGISSAGERPLPPGEDEIDDLSRPVLGDLGQATSTIVQALDASEAELVRGPDPYLDTGDNLVPGWAVALLALALLAPALVAAVDASGWALRRSQGLTEALIWAVCAVVPLLAGLIALYALALVGLVDTPDFPFDPGRHGLDAATVASTILIVAAIAGAAVAIRPLRVALDAPRAGLVAAVGITSVAAGLLAWLANPYLGLLAAPAAHAWLLAAAGAGAGGAALGVVAALAPLVIALGVVASALGLGVTAPWTFAVMVAGGQLPFGVAASICVLVASLVAVVAVARRMAA